MFRPIFALASLSLLVLVTTCSLKSHRPEVIVTSRLANESVPVSGSTSRVNPPVSGMDCYLILFSAPGFDDLSNADTGGLDHSCLRLAGRSSALVDYATIRSGVSSSLPLGSYAIEIMGLYRNGSSACVGQSLRQVFDAGTPAVYSLATKATSSFTGASSLQLTSAYDVGSAVNLATSCTGSLTSWKFVDGNGTNGLNYNVGEAGVRPRLVNHNGKLYVLWDEENVGTVKQIRARVYNGNDGSPAWTFVDGNGANGKNFNTGESASELDAVSFDSSLFVTWQEARGSSTTIRVKTYNGNESSPVWAIADGGGATGLNFDSLRNAMTPSLAINAAKLYLTWSEIGAAANVSQIRVVKYNSVGSWSFVDGNGVTGLNFNIASSATAPHMVSFNGKLYLFWQEFDSASVLHSKVYNGNDSSPSWVSVDGAGLNQLATHPASNVEPKVFNGKLYLTWREQNNSAIYQIRVAVYNGDDSSPSWQLLDGNGDSGLNYNTNKHGYFPVLVPFGTTLFAAWSEDAMVTAQIRVRRYNGNDLAPSWTSADGGGIEGINHLTIYSAFYPRAATFNSKLYLAWNEINPTYQIRVVVGQ